ncbi:unnamed protein product [Rotaria sp. Silwood2]|nr:unnamed protein product [Rotaria sp. Silwood2]
MWYRLILTVVRLMTNYGNSKDETIMECGASYYIDAKEQIRINYFVQCYSPARALDCRQNLTVYRGQRLRMKEIELLRNNVNNPISMNSFLSTSLKQAVAKIFADTSDQVDKSFPPLQSVLFIIDIQNITKEMHHLQLALEMGKKTLSPDNMDLVDYNINVVRTYDILKQLKLAVDHFESSVKL